MVRKRLAEMKGDRTIATGKGDQRLLVPQTPAALADILSEHHSATIVAGSTDVGLWVTKQMRALNPVVFITGIDALQTITETPEGLTMGAGVSYSRAFAALSRLHPAIGKLIDRIGGEQVRNMGTIGGNIANGSPIGDTPPALIALGATVKLTARTGSRTLALEDFFIEYGRQDRRKDEFVESVFVPAVPPGNHYAVYKISKRRDEDISALCGGFRIALSADGIVTEATIAFGGMAGTPKRAKTVETALVGKPGRKRASRPPAPPSTRITSR